MEASYEIGAVVAGRYRIEGTLGRGGMGVVLAATDARDGRPIALKLLKRELIGDAGTRERFAREARATVRLRSPYVCQVFDVGELEDGVPFMAMERLNGNDLSRALKERGPFAVAVAVDAILQACEGLHEAHRLGIVHRDLKPGNLFDARLPDGSQVVKVLDFGIARTVGPQEGDTLTATGSILGSPHYMSPEQIVSPKSVDERSDIWSLGVILYRLLANALPFDADSFGRLAILIAADRPAPLLPRRPDCPAGLDLAIQRALEKEPSARFPNVAAFAAAIAPFGTFPSTVATLAGAYGASTVGPSAAPSLPPPAAPAALAQLTGRSSSITANAVSIATAAAPPARSPLPLVAGALAIVLAGAGAFFAAKRLAPHDAPVGAVAPSPPASSAQPAPTPQPPPPTAAAPSAEPSAPAPATPSALRAAPAPNPVASAPRRPVPSATGAPDRPKNPLDLGLKR